MTVMDLRDLKSPLKFNKKKYLRPNDIKLNEVVCKVSVMKAYEMRKD